MMSVAMADTVRRRPVGQDDLVIWVLAAVTGAVVLVLYRRMLRDVTVVVPARTHLAGWRSLGIADGADRWLFLVFTFSDRLRQAFGSLTQDCQPHSYVKPVEQMLGLRI